MVSLFREQNLLTNKYWTERCASPCLSVLGKNKLCTAPDSHVAKVQICRVFWEKYYLFNCFLFICMGDLKESQNKHEKAMISTSFFSSKSKPNWHQIEILHNFNSQLPDTVIRGFSYDVTKASGYNREQPKKSEYVLTNIPRSTTSTTTSCLWIFLSLQESKQRGTAAIYFR